MPEPGGDQSQTKVRRGTMPQQGPDPQGIQPHMGTGHTGAVASGSRGLVSLGELSCPSTAGMPTEPAQPLPPLRAWARQGGASRAAETRGDFDSATGQSDKTGGRHNRPLETPRARNQPRSGAAGAAAGLGTITAPARESDLLSARAAASGEANRGQGLAERSRWWQELPGAPGRTHMWPAECPRAQTALATLKHTTGTC